MKKLLILEIDKYIYTLRDDNNNKYILNLDFFEVQPSVNDIIYIDEELLNQKNFYTFGPLEGEYGKI